MLNSSSELLAKKLTTICAPTSGKGPLTGGGVGDIMLHVPTDRELAMRNKEAVVGNPYFQETIARRD